MPNFAVLDFQLKRGYAHWTMQNTASGPIPIFIPNIMERLRGKNDEIVQGDAPAVMVLNPPDSEIIPGKLVLTNMACAVESLHEIATNPATKKAVLDVGSGYQVTEYNFVPDQNEVELEKYDRRYFTYKQRDSSADVNNPFVAGGTEGKSKFDKAYDFIEENINKGNQVIVHCNVGQSRSTAVVIGYLMRKYAMPFDLALYHVGACRYKIESGNFIKHLRAYEKALGIDRLLGIDQLPATLPIEQRLDELQRRFFAYQRQIAGPDENKFLNNKVPVIKWDTVSYFLQRNKKKIVLLGLGIIVASCLIALSIAFPPVFLVGLVGAGVLGSGGAIASTLLLGSLGASTLFAVMAGGIATLAALVSLIGVRIAYSLGVEVQPIETKNIHQAHERVRAALRATTALSAATSTAVAPVASNAANAVLNAVGNSSNNTPTPVDGDVFSTSKSPFETAKANGSTSSVSAVTTKQSPAPGPG